MTLVTSTSFLSMRENYVSETDLEQRPTKSCLNIETGRNKSLIALVSTINKELHQMICVGSLVKTIPD